MKIAPYPILLAVALFVCSLPSHRAMSQAVPPPAEPLAALQALQNANDDLLKRQETTLKELTDMTAEAREAKLFSRRG